MRLLSAMILCLTATGASLAAMGAWGRGARPSAPGSVVLPPRAGTDTPDGEILGIRERGGNLGDWVIGGAGWQAHLRHRLPVDRYAERAAGVVVIPLHQYDIGADGARAGGSQFAPHLRGELLRSRAAIASGQGVCNVEPYSANGGQSGTLGALGIACSDGGSQCGAASLGSLFPRLLDGCSGHVVAANQVAVHGFERYASGLLYPGDLVLPRADLSRAAKRKAIGGHERREKLEGLDVRGNRSAAVGPAPLAIVAPYLRGLAMSGADGIDADADIVLATSPTGGTPAIRPGGLQRGGGVGEIRTGETRGQILAFGDGRQTEQDAGHIGQRGVFRAVQDRYWLAASVGEIPASGHFLARHAVLPSFPAGARLDRVPCLGGSPFTTGDREDDTALAIAAARQGGNLAAWRGVVASEWRVYDGVAAQKPEGSGKRGSSRAEPIGLGDCILLCIVFHALIISD